MKPRLESSLEWTAFPAEFIEKIIEVFENTYPSQKAQGQFFVDGRFYQSEILFKVGFLQNGRLRQHNFLFSVEFDPKKQNARDLIIQFMDPMGAYLDDFFSGKTDEEDYPIQWKEVEFGELQYAFMYSTENTQLEAEADRLLGIDNSELYKDHEPTGDAMEQATVDTELAQDIQKKIRKGEYHH